MRRAAVLGLLAVVAVGLVVVAVAGSRAERLDAFSTGLESVVPLTVLDPGATACQAPIPVPERLRIVALTLTPVGEEEFGPFEVTVRGATPEAVPQAVIGRAEVPRGTPPGPFDVELDRPVPAERLVAACVTNRGRGRVQAWGDDFPQRTPATSMAVDERGRPLRGDLFVRFPAAQPSSVLERLPATFEHAAPFKLGGIGAWVFWVLAALVLLGVPALLAWALQAADDDSPGR